MMICLAGALVMLFVFGVTAPFLFLLLYGGLLSLRPHWMESPGGLDEVQQSKLREKVIDSSSRPLPWYLSPLLPLTALVLAAIGYGLATFG